MADQVDKPIRVEVKVGRRHAILARYRDEMGISQAEMARRCGVGIAQYNAIELLKIIPGPRVSQRIADHMGLGIVQLFPPELADVVGTEKAFQIFKDVDIPEFLSLSARQDIALVENRPSMLPETAAEDHSLQATIAKLLQSLPERERIVLERTVMEDDSLGLVARDLDITKEGVRQIREKGLGHLRDKVKFSRLKAF